MKMVFCRVEVELIYNDVFLVHHVRLFFKRKSIKQRNCKMNCTISNFNEINQKNKVTAMLRNTILQFRCSCNLSSMKKSKKNATIAKPKKTQVTLLCFQNFLRRCIWGAVCKATQYKILHHFLVNFG